MTREETDMQGHVTAGDDLATMNGRPSHAPILEELRSAASIR